MSGDGRRGKQQKGGAWWRRAALQDPGAPPFPHASVPLLETLTRPQRKFGYERIVMVGDGATDLEARQPDAAGLFIGCALAARQCWGRAARGQLLGVRRPRDAAWGVPAPRQAQLLRGRTAHGACTPVPILLLPTLAPLTLAPPPSPGAINAHPPTWGPAGTGAWSRAPTSRRRRTGTSTRLQTWRTAWAHDSAAGAACAGAEKQTLHCSHGCSGRRRAGRRAKDRRGA